MEKNKPDARLITPPLLQEQALDFVKIPSNPLTDNLSRVYTAITPLDLVGGEATLSIGGIDVSMTDYEAQASILGTRTHKLNALGLALLLEQNEWKPPPDKIKTHVAFSIDLLIEATGAKNTERNRKKVAADTQDDLRALESVRLKWKPKTQAGREHDEIRCPVIGGNTGVLNGAVYITYSKDYARTMLNSFISRLHPNSWQISARIPAAWPLNCKLHTYYFNDKNRKQGTHDRLSVAVILDWLSQIIPSEKDVKESDRHYKKRIVTPLEKALNEIERVGVIKWEYCNAKRAPLTKKQKAAAATGDYFTIKDLYISFDIAGAEQELEKDTERLERKEDALIKRLEMEEKAKQKALDQQAKEALEKTQGEAKV